jgi:two-component system NarL family response regulator
VSLRVALVDDHQPFRERLRALLQRDRHIEIALESRSADELLEAALHTDIDVVCMDIRLPGLSGVEATRRLLAMKPQVRVIGLSAYADPHYVEAMLDAGAAGHFTKGDVGEPLLRAIHEATAAQPRFGENIRAVTAAASDSPDLAGPIPAAADTASLRPREAEVLRLIGEGTPPAAIAAALGIEPAMVDVYRRNIARRLNLRDADALDDYARRRSSSR